MGSSVYKLFSFLEENPLIYCIEVFQSVKMYCMQLINKPFIHSDVSVTNAGAPQGTRAGPNDFKVLINDLCFDYPYIKYVDDVTVAAVSTDAQINNLQLVANELVEWCADNNMHLNTSKTKEMVI